MPPEHPRIKRVNTIQELVTTPFANGVNALCWLRTLPGDFNEVVEQLKAGEGITALGEDGLNSLKVNAAGRTAIDMMLADLGLLRALGRDPVLNCVNGYPRDEDPGPVATDVFSFHVDRAPVEADTWLCTYHGAASQGLGNDEALRRADVPATRAELLRQFGGADNGDFRAYLNDNCYDLHYIPVPGGQPWSFGMFNLWRIAVDWPGSPVPPCIHRAPETKPGDPVRLLLIS